MKNINLRSWGRLLLLSLFIVASLGVLMRYKIGFSFPYLDQKNLQHAHSHFSFSGWISQSLFVFIVHTIAKNLSNSRLRLYRYLLYLNWLSAFAMLVAFAIQGYAFFPILFSSISVLVSVAFTIFLWTDLRNDLTQSSCLWIKSALIFLVLSNFGTLSLGYMMFTKSIHQHTYLASVYWYLHFQYNGWFFFGTMGLLYNYFGRIHTIFSSNNLPFYLLVTSCLPVYGLSVLWTNLPIWIEVIIALATLTQAVGWGLIIRDTIRTKALVNHVSLYIKSLLFIATIAGVIKFSLQLGSTIPALSKLTFGFRPIVIAYLHLVLLAFISLLLIAYLFISKGAILNRLAKIGLIIFVSGIFLNETLLAVQGIASFSYTVVPHINNLLFIVALVLLTGSGLLLTSQFLKNTVPD